MRRDLLLLLGGTLIGALIGAVLADGAAGHAFAPASWFWPVAGICGGIGVVLLVVAVISGLRESAAHKKPALDLVFEGVGTPCVYDFEATEQDVPLGTWHTLVPAVTGSASPVGNTTAHTLVRLHAPPGWRMAGIIRERQVQHGDTLLVLGGGAGAEHLAELYRDEGKPVIPIWTELGAYNEDGSGGSRALHEQALDTPTKFFALRPGVGSEAARLSSLRLTSDTDPASFADEVASLIGDLKPPTAFFVRLLDTDDPDYGPVESFFRDVVDHVVSERGYTTVEMGRGKPEAAFMNVEIFATLHRAGLVIVDLTGMRPNCTMELGYALGRRRRVVTSAKTGTKLIFDADKLPTYFWDPTSKSDRLQREFGEWFDRYSELPPIVE